MDWNQVPTPVRVCCAALWEAGYEACPVGGCIRDTLLGRPPGDWDVASSALPETVVSLFPRTVPTGLRHGTVTVLLGDMSLEVTAFRREGDYADGRHPDAVSFGVGLREDLARRDFTVNAMALRRDGTLADPFGGQADLDAGLIRCVGNPDRRFQEDALRLLRAVRFAAQLDFTLENSTAAALHRNAGRLDLVSGERVKAELEKILLSPRPALAALPAELGMLTRFGVPAAPVDLRGLESLSPTPEVRWRRFCRVSGLDITRLPVERRIRRAVLRSEGPEPVLTGRDLYDLGLRGGEIGRVRKALEAFVLAHPEANTRRALLDRADALKEGLRPPE